MAIKISSRSDLPPFMVMDVMKKAEEMKDPPRRVLRMELGQPSTAAPEPAIDAIIHHISHPASHGYTTSRGTPEVVGAIARHYRRQYGLEIKPEQILTTIGSSLGFMMAFLTCFEQGDTIAMTAPGYAAYRNLMLSTALKPMLIGARAEEGWQLSVPMLEQMPVKPDGLIIASPANPTGVAMAADELKAIADWCNANDVRLVSDEIYHGINFTGQDRCVMEYSKTALVMNSFSKYFSMTGHRLGWVIAPDDLVEPFERLVQNCYISAPTLSQIAGAAAMDNPESYKEMEAHIERYRVNRDILVDGLSARFLGRFPYPEGGFYLYCDTSAISDDSIALADRMLSELCISTTPGVDFDDAEGHLAIRLSYAGSTDDMAEAVDRINRWLDHQETG